MNPIESFEACIAALTDLVGRCSEPQERCLGALEIVERTIAGRERLDLQRFVPSRNHYARHLIHRDPQDRFALLGIVWRPGQGTPIHDHQTWGVYGVLENKIRFVDYALDDGDLVLTGATVARTGSATTVLPPHSDIHRMENPTDEVTITLHCYGQEIKEFNIFQPTSGEKRLGTVSYDSLPC